MIGRKAKPDAPSYVLQSIFSEGRTIHARWQQLIWNIGKLRGKYECLSCRNEWWDTSPDMCPRCGVGREFLGYLEVPCYSDKYMLEGHADGDIDEGSVDERDDPIVEIKSINLRTLEIEAPETMERFKRRGVNELGRKWEVVDFKALWDNIRRPLRSHRIQGMLYAYMLGRKTIIFIYEAKWNQRHLEFVCQLDYELIEPILADCLSVVRAIEGGKRPKCKFPGECPQCRRYEETEKTNDGPRQRQSKHARSKAAAQQRAGASAPARRGSADRPRRRDDDDRRRSDGAVHGPHSLGRLFQRAIGSRRDQ